MNTPPRLDSEIFDELYESVCERRDTVALLYGTFLNNAVDLVTTLKEAESRAVREKTLHTLKGSAAMMGATCIARLASDLQQTCATMHDDTLRSWIEQLEAELEATRRDIDAQLASLERQTAVIRKT